MTDNNPALDEVLAVYRRELELQATFVLVILVEEYGLEVCGRQQCIDALVDHFHQQLLRGEG